MGMLASALSGKLPLLFFTRYIYICVYQVDVYMLPSLCNVVENRSEVFQQVSGFFNLKTLVFLRILVQ